MVPGVDMANHAAGDATAALFEVDADGRALLMLRDGKTIEPGEEVTITYVSRVERQGISLSRSRN